MKNPKRVEQGRRLAAHNKMKERLSKGLNDIDNQTAKTEQMVPEWTLKWGGLAIGVGIGILFFKWWNSRTPPDYFLEMDPVTPPVREPVPPKPEPEPEPELIMD